MDDSKRYRKELDERYQQRIKKNYGSSEKYLNKEPRKERVGKQMNMNVGNQYRQEVVVIDSNDRDKTKYPLVNDFVVNLSESIKNVLVIRLLRSEYTIDEAYANLIINNQKVPINIFKTFIAFVYMNGYSKIRVANETNSNFFSQISAGIDVKPSMTNNFFYDPYAVVMNPIEKSLKRFHVKICDSEGNVIPIKSDSTTRLILTLGIFTL